MKTDRKTILKRVLSGTMNTLQLKKALNHHQAYWLFTCTSGGLFSGHGYCDLSEAQVKEIAAGDYVFLLEEV